MTLVFEPLLKVKVASVEHSSIQYNATIIYYNITTLNLYYSYISLNASVLSSIVENSYKNTPTREPIVINAYNIFYTHTHTRIYRERNVI